MHLVLFKIGDTAGLIANASLNELLRDKFGSLVSENLLSRRHLAAPRESRRMFFGRLGRR